VCVCVCVLGGGEELLRKVSSRCSGDSDDGGDGGAVLNKIQ
jgi:hypothetical protein